MYFDPKL